MRDRALDLLRILYRYAPTDTERGNVYDTYTRMVNNKEPETVIEKWLINALADGINHGNWPWVNYSSDYQGTFGNEGDVIYPDAKIAGYIYSKGESDIDRDFPMVPNLIETD